MVEADGNLFKHSITKSNQQEVFDTLFESQYLKIERIITLLPFEKPGEWYDQEQDEWVLLLKGEAELEFKNEGICKLFAGDFIFIQAHKIHRVRRTNPDTPCKWLALFGKFK